MQLSDKTDPVQYRDMTRADVDSIYAQFVSAGWPKPREVLESYRREQESGGTAQRMYTKRGYIFDGSGAWDGSAPAKPYGLVENGDELVLYMSKKLGDYHKFKGLQGRERYKRKQSRTQSSSLFGSVRVST